MERPPRDRKERLFSWDVKVFWLLLAIASQLLLTAVLSQLQAIRDAFGVLIPSVTDIGIILGVGLFVLISMEVVKAVLRAKLKVGREIRP
jgi:hypothetical protein